MQGLQPLIVASTVGEPIVSPPVRDGCAQENERKSYSRKVFPSKSHKTSTPNVPEVLISRCCYGELL